MSRYEPQTQRYPRHCMIVGYEDSDGSHLCVACWEKKSEAERRPNALLTDEPDEGGDIFWHGENCDGCGESIQYISVQLLD